MLEDATDAFLPPPPAPPFPTLPRLTAAVRWVHQVVGRLAGDQRGVVREALVSEGVMEALLAILEDNARLSAVSTTAVPGLALLCLADLSAGSERAKVRHTATATGQVLHGGW